MARRFDWVSCVGVVAAMTCFGVATASAQGKAIKVSALETPDFSKIKIKKTKLEGFVPQVGHSRHISSVSFSSDGALMATASGIDDGVLKIWDVKAKHLLHTLDGEDYAALSPDGSLVVSGNVGGPIKVWSTKTWELIKTLDGGGPLVFSADGKFLISDGISADGMVTNGEDTGPREGALMRWDTTTWAPQVLQFGHEAAISAMSITTDGRFVATGSFDESIKVWDMKTGEIVRTFKEGVRVPASIAISPDGETLAVSYRDGSASVEVWDISAGKIDREISHSKYVTQLAFSRDGALLGAACLDGKTRLFDPSSGAEKQSFDGSGHVAFSTDNTSFVHGDHSLTMRSLGGDKLHEFEANESLVFQTAFSPDGKKLITTDARGRVDTWDVRTGKLLKTRAIETAEEARTGELILSTTGALVARRPFVGAKVRVWSTQTGKLEYEVELEDIATIRGISFAPNDKEIVLEGANGPEGTEIVWWSLEEGAQLNATKFSGYMSVDGFIDDGKNVALVSLGSTRKSRLSLKLWNRETGLLESIKAKDIPPFAGDVDFAGHGELIALGDVDNTIKLWSRSESKFVATLSKHDDLVDLLEFSPDGRLLATGGWDESVKIWDVEKGTLALSMTGIMYKAQHFTFSPNDDVVAISHKGWLKLVHLPTGRARTLYRLGEGWLAYDSSGHFACAGSGCDLATYRTTDGQYIEHKDSRIKKLKKLDKFGR